MQVHEFLDQQNRLFALWTPGVVPAEAFLQEVQRRFPHWLERLSTDHAAPLANPSHLVQHLHLAPMANGRSELPYGFSDAGDDASIPVTCIPGPAYADTLLRRPASPDDGARNVATGGQLQGTLSARC